MEAAKKGMEEGLAAAEKLGEAGAPAVDALTKGLEAVAKANEATENVASGADKPMPSAVDLSSVPTTQMPCVAECSKSDPVHAADCPKKCGVPELPGGAETLPGGWGVSDALSPPAGTKLPPGAEMPASMTKQATECFAQCMKDRSLKLGKAAMDKGEAIAASGSVDAGAVESEGVAMGLKAAEMAAECGLCCAAGVCMSGELGDLAASAISGGVGQQALGAVAGGM